MKGKKEAPEQLKFVHGPRDAWFHSCQGLRKPILS